MKLILALAFASVFITGIESYFYKHHNRPKNDERTECTCLHGGICSQYGIYKKIYRCVCPAGYTGKYCEIDSTSKCYKDNGYDYRGTASKTSSGAECLHWDSPLLRNHQVNAHMKDALKFGIGKHNYCRNPHNGLRPWCYFKGPKGVTSMFCKLHQCEEIENTEPTCGRRQQKLYKIVGGMSSPIESHPWIASLYQINRRNRKEKSFQCGASLIHPCWALTAAHCFDSEEPEPKDYTIVLGKSNLEEDNEYREQRFLVEKIIIHESYSDQTGALNNDIALVKIRSESGQCASMTDYVQTVCLPTADLKFQDETSCEIAGFGKETYDSYKSNSQTLKSTSVQLISQDICQSPDYYGKLINNNMFCAGDPEWKVDACKGDSGGPLICRHNGKMVLYGIISWGEGCAKKNKPGVYTRVTNYMQWIQDNMADTNNVRSIILPK